MEHILGNQGAEELLRERAAQTEGFPAALLHICSLIFQEYGKTHSHALLPYIFWHRAFNLGKTNSELR